MTSKLLIRISALLVLFHLAGHTLGHLNWKTSNNPIRKEVIKQMTDHAFVFMGAKRSMADYYQGYSLLMFVVYLMSAAILWLLANISDQHPNIVKKLILIIAASFIVMCFIEFFHFFTFAAGISFSVAITLLISSYQLRNQQISQ